MKKVTLPLKENIGQLVGKVKLLFFFLFTLLQRNTILGKVMVHYGEIRKQAAVNLVLLFCGKVQTPPVMKKCRDKGLLMKK